MELWALAQSNLGVGLSSGIIKSDNMNKLREIACVLINAPNKSTMEASVDDLKRSFKGLAEIIGSEEDAVAPRELSSSGLIRALLLCLSSSSCTNWCKVVR